jgi:predicted nucleic-acid-binding Zn-ribbon protein
MMRPCSKCQGNMRGDTQFIPKQVPLPGPLALPINVENYLPNLIKYHTKYTIFVCDNCGYLETYIHD